VNAVACLALKVVEVHERGFDKVVER